ncbi:sacsin-like [Ylistrum balloti]|uniref:sacsin-like n=1 Tax=Ylistrum balloti TaxID=509963 RepID=UPI002905A129|nr:sacsin-like [Ylistrum balloti]
MESEESNAAIQKVSPDAFQQTNRMTENVFLKDSDSADEENMDWNSDSTDSDSAMEQPSLLEQLKTILDTYQDAQIIRELIQNADDASASEMKITYVTDDPGESQEQPKHSGCYSEYFRSPALCVYNDGVFNRKDWTYVKSIYRSGKREDSFKIGRFGLGFKSVFHLTDNPVIISGDQILVIDPFRSKNKLGNDCHTLKFEKLCKSVQKKRRYKDALVALEKLYGHCGFTKESMKDGYHGTLFWFPFRRFPSELSTKVFDHSDVGELISMFKNEAHCLPLFLRNINQVSFYENGNTSSSFSVKCITLEDEKRKSFNLKLAECKGRTPDEDMETVLLVTVIVQERNESKKQQWIVCRYVKGMNNLSADLRALSDDKYLSYCPLVGIAVPVNDTLDNEFHGQVFCFLPLPSSSENSTGLPVHINGFFALSQDRNHVKWPTDDKLYREDKAQTWNRLLCEEVIVDAYTLTLEYIKGLTDCEQRIESDSLVNKTLPSRANVHSNWVSIVDPLYRSLEDKNTFYTKHDGGKWIQPKDAVFSILNVNEEEVCAINDNQMEQCIVNFLLDSGRNVVNVPMHVAKSFPGVQRITPNYLRDVMKENYIYTKLSTRYKLLLLQFVLIDRQYTDLGVFQLLPLEDGTFGWFNDDNPKYICTEDELKMFPGIEQNFVKLDIPQILLDHLDEILNEVSSNLVNFCLRRLNKDDFPDLLEKTLSANGKKTHTKYLDISGIHITMDWLDRVWGYIDQHYNTLEDFEYMPLIPGKNIIDSETKHISQLMQLKGKYVVAECGGMESLNQNLRSAISNLKIAVIPHIPKGETYNVLMGTHCKYPYLKDVLELLEKNDDMYSTIRHFNERSSKEEKTALLDFLSKDSQIASTDADYVLGQLDIFSETTNVNNDLQYTSISKNGKIACRTHIPIKYPFPLLHLESSHKILAERLGATQVEECYVVEEILRNIINGEGGYSRSNIEDFMMFLLIHLNSVRGDHEKIFDLGSRVKFIEVSYSLGDIAVASIRQFFDHTNRNLQELFHFDKAKLLPPKYQKDDIEWSLKKLGLKSEDDVKTEDICNVVKILDEECNQHAHTAEDNVRKCSCQVMKLLEKLTTQSAVSLGGLHLNKYRWITYLKHKPPHYPSVLPWYGQELKSILCSPEDVFSTKFESLSASVKCITATSLYPNLAEGYGWDTPPSVEICLLQLKVLRKVFNIKDKAALIYLIKHIYQQLFDSIITSRVEELQSEELVCTQEGFHLPEKVYVSFPTNENISLEPFMYKLPAEFSEFSSMFIFLGSKAELTINSMKPVLTTIKRTTTNSTTERDRKMVIDILKCIVSLKDENESLDDVLVPVKSDNASLDLHQVKDCTYFDVDSGWMCNSEFDVNIRNVHSDVSTDLAESLGIRSVTQRFLSDGGTEEISACGQSEPLTTRLKNILENYPDGMAVFKELVQNAADAGAQRIKFLYDERRNKDARTGLINANMAECQGPALWAYNDAQFTESDFQNIINLGGGTKKGTKFKIGKFGLGFCVMYNLTDVPSFVSGHSLVIFDPHTTYLGKAIKDKSSPGLRLTFTEKSSGILKLMENQFHPYNKIFGCDLSGSTFPPNFKGTLFRFPLRTKQQAVRSAIKSTPYTRDDMVGLLHLFKDCAGDMLTFTQNIKEIELYHLPEESLNPVNDTKLIFSIEKAVIKTTPLMEGSADIHVMQEVESASRKNQDFVFNELISVNLSMPKSRLLKVKNIYFKSSLWLVAWASGSNRSLPEDTNHFKSEREVSVGSVAVSLKGSHSKRTAVPFPHQEKQIGFYDTSHYFCFLPLPVECQLPVHINGSFAVRSDRKGLVKRTSDEKGETMGQIWNKMLMSDAVCNAYISMMTCLDGFGIVLENYESLWPIPCKETDGDPNLTKSFCEKVINGDYEVFHTTIGRRATFSGSIFLDNDFRHNKTVGDLAFGIFQSLFRGINLPMDMSKELYSQFCTSGCKERLDQQTLSVKNFFEDIFFRNIKFIDGNKRDALVMFILQDSQHYLQQLLKSNPCIPVKQDRRLRLPNELVRPNSKVSNLFREKDGRFPSDANQPFRKDKILDVLVHLGMVDRTLSDEMIVERAESIANLPDRKEALDRCRKLLAYLDGEHDRPEIYDVLSRTAFLPSLRKPIDWPLSWVRRSAKTKNKFFPPNQMFFPRDMERIACSQLIVDEEEIKSDVDVKKVLRLLGIRRKCSRDNIEAQLLASRVRFKDLTDKQKNKLHSICLSVYKYMNFLREPLTEKYDDLPIIWMTNCLVSPKRITMETFHDIDCSPAIYQLGSSDIGKYKTFLKLVGVQEKLSHGNILTALTVVRMDSKDKCLRVSLTVQLLRLLSTVCERHGITLSSAEKSRIHVPDDSNVFRPVEELCVDDGYQLKRQNYMHFVNPKVSMGTIKFLGIISKRQKHLHDIKGSMPFGQKEELVTRLRGIIEGYPPDETILYELLQNADDAGSREIVFIQDVRQHEIKNGIFGKKWSAIQGPALCVFNDSCFSSADLEGICKLGEGTKSKNPLKAGQFGVGFNVVYHLTDAPSFITKGPTTPNNGTFCVFDPHCSFCPATDDNPGMQIPDLGELEETYPGIFECYLQKEMPRSKGTWFRFPLRNESMASSSRICNNPMDSGELSYLIQKFKLNVKKCLLFLRNVRKISLCEIDITGNIKTNYTVSSSLHENDERNLEEFTTASDTLTKALYDKSADIKEIEFQMVQYNMTIQEHDYHQPEHWIVSQTFGFESSVNIPESVSAAFQCGEIALTPKGAVAVPNVSRNKGKEEENTGREYIDSTEYFHQSHVRGGFVQLSGASTQTKEEEGQAFCFLPLPLKTGLPVHINGHFALIQTRGSMWEKTYRGDWNRLLLGTIISNSYVQAIECLRDNFLVNDVNREELTMTDIKSRLKNYHEAFPRYEEGKTDLIKCMISSFFALLYKKESTVFPVLSANGTHIWWVALQQNSHAFPACFDNTLDQFLQMPQLNETRYYQYSFQFDKKRNLECAVTNAHNLTSILKNIGMKLLESPIWIHESMRQALKQESSISLCQYKSDEHLISPSTVIQFIRVGNTSPDACLLYHVNSKVTDTPVKSIDNVNRLLRYCVIDLESFQQHMDQLPLLVTNDDILRCFSSTSPVILSQFCDLLPWSAKHFVHINIVDVLENIPLQSYQCFKGLDLNTFARMLPQNFDKTILSGPDQIPWNEERISRRWMKTFWRYLDSLEEKPFEELGNWCLIPGKLNTPRTFSLNEVLVPFDKSFILLDSCTFRDEYLRSVFSSLKVTKPNVFLYNDTLKYLVASQTDPIRLVQCLHYYKNHLEYLEISQCKAILQHLSQSENIRKLKQDASIVAKLRDLPLFTTVTGINVKLQTNNLRIFIVKKHCELDKDGMQTWMNSYGCILLEENYSTFELMSYLYCNQIISVPELYCEHILPFFYHLERNHHLTHLEYVRRNLKDVPDCPFKEALRTSKFIYQNGSVKSAANFYDPRNRLFQKLFDQSMFPPNPFGYNEWKTLMVSAGMKNTVSADLFVKFAKQIESSGQTRGMTENIRAQSNEIVRYLFAERELYTDIDLLKKIKKHSLYNTALCSIYI